MILVSCPFETDVIEILCKGTFSLVCAWRLMRRIIVEKQDNHVEMRLNNGSLWRKMPIFRPLFLSCP